MNIKKLILFLIMSAGLLTLIYIFLIKRPANNRDWESGFSTFPSVQINEETKEITINNIRDWRFVSGKPVSFDYKNITYKIEDLEKTWFLVEPFSKWDGIAHTFFIFDFKDQDPIVFSIEARREKGEKYSAFMGALNQYELIYFWGTERDILGRIVSDGADVYMYELNLTNESSQNLFKQLATNTAYLEQNPKFYNTLTSNCTNLLAKAANQIKKGIVPWHYSFIFPGFAAEYLYELGYFASDLAFDDLKSKSNISEYVKSSIMVDNKNFSLGLRTVLATAQN